MVGSKYIHQTDVLLAEDIFFTEGPNSLICLKVEFYVISEIFWTPWRVTASRGDRGHPIYPTLIYIMRFNGFRYLLLISVCSVYFAHPIEKTNSVSITQGVLKTWTYNLVRVKCYILSDNNIIPCGRYLLNAPLLSFFILNIIYILLI